MRNLGVLLLVACGGGQNFTGTWTGELSFSGGCQDHSGGFGTSSPRWILKETAAKLTITPEGGSCGDLTAEVSGCVASLDEKICPLNMDGSSTGFSAGSLSLNANDLLFVAFEQTLVATNGDICINHAEGSMQREP